MWGVIYRGDSLGFRGVGFNSKAGSAGVRRCGGAFVRRYRYGGPNSTVLAAVEAFGRRHAKITAVTNDIYIASVLAEALAYISFEDRRSQEERERERV